MQNQQLTSDEKPSLFMPYSPALRQLLGSYGASLLLIYLEREQQDHFTLHIGRTLARLHLSRGRLMGHLWMIAVGWPSQRKYLLARQAGRGFISKATRGAGAIKPYCYVRLDHETIEIYRNRPRVQQLLAQAGLIAGEMCESVDEEMRGFNARLSDFGDEIGAFARAFHAEVLAPLNDARSRPGIKRAAHARRPWTEERRKRYEATIEAKRKAIGR